MENVLDMKTASECPRKVPKWDRMEIAESQVRPHFYAARSLLEYRVVKGAEGLTKMQARIWEQKLILQNGGKNGGQLLNKINSIAEKYWEQYGIR